MTIWGGPKKLPVWLNCDQPINIVCADTFKQRLFGLHIWPDWGQSPQALLFRNCNSVHTLGLYLPIDILFFDTDGQLLSLNHMVRKNTWCRVAKARHVLELPGGYCQGKNLNVLPLIKAIIN